MRRQVIFDTDPSPDDAVAFLAALASPEEFEVLAITTVAGNVPVELTAKNARKALELDGSLAEAQDRLLKIEKQRVAAGEDAPAELLSAEQARIQHAAQPGGQTCEKRPVENHEEIVEAEVEPEPE